MATRALAAHFDVAVGSDAGESMIRVAEELGGETAKKGERIRWVVCPAEGVDEIAEVDTGSVDLVIAAYAVSFLLLLCVISYVYMLCLGF